MAQISLGWNLMATGSALVAGFAARKILKMVWEKSTGSAPPSNPESPNTTWAEALSWAVVSGVVYGVARLIATREAAGYYKRSTGHLPPNLEEASA